MTGRDVSVPQSDVEPELDDVAIGPATLAAHRLPDRRSAGGDQRPSTISALGR